MAPLSLGHGCADMCQGAVPALLPVHDLQLQTYLRMSGLPVGLLFNFHAPRLKDGLRRFVG